MKHILMLLCAAGVFAAGAARADAVEDLLKANKCTNCHAADKKKVGPSFKESAAKFKGDKEAEAKVVAILKDGKVEGRPHPAKVTAGDADLKTMAQYVLSVK